MDYETKGLYYLLHVRFPRGRFEFRSPCGQSNGFPDRGAFACLLHATQHPEPADGEFCRERRRTLAAR